MQVCMQVCIWRCAYEGVYMQVCLCRCIRGIGVRICCDEEGEKEIKKFTSIFDLAKVVPFDRPQRSSTSHLNLGVDDGFPLHSFKLVFPLCSEAATKAAL